jgi:hypothetical protein
MRFGAQLRQTAPAHLPNLPETNRTSHRLQIVVVFTFAQATVFALKKAATLAKGLNARVTLVAPHVVPYPLELENPLVQLAFTQRRLNEIASQSPVETTVRLYLCRHPLQTLIGALKPNSLVIVAGHKRWWKTKEQKLALNLHRFGHQVIFTDSD